LFARIEAGQVYGTGGVPIENGRWYHVAAVKRGAVLTLYLDGHPAASCPAPERVRTASAAVGVGFNPLYAGGEQFAGRMDGFAFYARALTDEEIQDLASTE